MSNEEAYQTIFEAAIRLARHCEKGSTISFNNDFDEQEGELIREAVAHLTKRALDVANAVPDGISLHNYLNHKLIG